MWVFLLSHIFPSLFLLHLLFPRFSSAIMYCFAAASSFLNLIPIPSFPLSLYFSFPSLPFTLSFTRNLCFPCVYLCYLLFPLFYLFFPNLFSLPFLDLVRSFFLYPFLYLQFKYILSAVYLFYLLFLLPFFSTFYSPYSHCLFSFHLNLAFPFFTFSFIRRSGMFLLLCIHSTIHSSFLPFLIFVSFTLCFFPCLSVFPFHFHHFLDHQIMYIFLLMGIPSPFSAPVLILFFNSPTLSFPLYCSFPSSITFSFISGSCMFLLLDTPIFTDFFYSTSALLSPLALPKLFNWFTSQLQLTTLIYLTGKLA